VRALFYGLGSDGTVGREQEFIKIIGSETPELRRRASVYDSKKSGSMTTSHLRSGRSRFVDVPDFGASFVACHNFSFLEKMNVVERRCRARCSC